MSSGSADSKASDRIPVKTVVPSALQSEHRTGCSWLTAALGMDCPDCCTSQHRTWLSHEVAMRWFAAGLKHRLVMPSDGGAVISMSLLGLCAAVAWVCPNGPPNSAIRRQPRSAGARAHTRAPLQGSAAGSRRCRLQAVTRMSRQARGQKHMPVRLGCLSVAPDHQGWKAGSPRRAGPGCGAEGGGGGGPEDRQGGGVGGEAEAEAEAGRGGADRASWLPGVVLWWCCASPLPYTPPALARKTFWHPVKVFIRAKSNYHWLYSGQNP